MVDASPPATTDDSTNRKRIVNRLRRLEGQVRGLQSMIESDKECEAVLTQVMAAKSALNQVGMHVIGHAMKKCLIDETLTDRDEIVNSAFGVYLHFRELSGAREIPSSSDVATTSQVVALLQRLETEILRRSVSDVGRSRLRGGPQGRHCGDGHTERSGTRRDGKRYAALSHR